MMMEARVNPPVCNHMIVYYQTFEKSSIGISSKTKKKLRCFGVDTTCPVEAYNMAMKEMHDTMEVFIEPMLVLVQGGKA